MIRDYLKIIFLAFLVFTGQAYGAGFVGGSGSLKMDIATITSSGGITIVNSSSNQILVVTGSANHTVKLPDATTLKTGLFYSVRNESSGSVNVTDSTGSVLKTLTASQDSAFFLNSKSTAAGVWYDFFGSGGGSGGTAPVYSVRLAAPSGSACAIATQYGNWISGTPVSGSTGRCEITLNFTPTNPLVCTCSAYNNTTRLCSIESLTTSVVDIATFTTGGSLENNQSTVICNGQ